MEHLLLGIGLGLVSILPPGPVAIGLVEVGSRRGPAAALRGGLGVAGGDFCVVWVALAIIGAGSTLPPWAFSASQMLAAAVLIILGVSLLARPERCTAVVERIERPGRAFFLITSLTPTVLGAWVALLAAMPFATDLGALVRFALGAVAASLLYHPLLGLAIGQFGRRADERQRRVLTRLGGIATVTMGAVAMVALV